MAKRWSYEDFVTDARTRVDEVSCEALAQLRETATNLAILDVRETDEVEEGIIPGALALQRGLLEKHVHEHLPDRTRPVFVYCSTGKRSALAADTLLRMGYAEVRNLGGGFERWRHMGLPISGHSGICLLNQGKLSWEEVRREFAIVARRVPVLGSGSRELVYLDHAASTHAPASVLQAFVQFIEREYANVHRGTHILSRKATERFEEAYYVVADFLGANLSDGVVCFTGNTTQSIDLASFVMSQRPGKVITTQMEHHSNELPHRNRGPVLQARVTDDGRIDFDHLQSLLRNNEVKLLAMTAGSNVTGVMPDVHRAARMAHEFGALILVDAAQALARCPLQVGDFDDPGHIDFLAAAGHKAYAPFGSAFLYGPRALMNEAPPYLPGGGTASRVSARSAAFLEAPDRHQGGTPNIAGVVGFARALMFVESIGRDAIREHEIALTRATMDAFEEMGGVTVYGPRDPEARLGVVSFNVDGVDDLRTAAVLSEEGGLAVRNGRFCAHMYVDRLLAASAAGNKSGQVPKGCVRASFGLYSDLSDVERLVEQVRKVRERRWVGRYRIVGDEVSSEFAGRCADRWMESTGEPEQAGEPAPDGYHFEVFHVDASTRAYLFADPVTRKAALVDPLRERVEEYLSYLNAHGLELAYTIESHTHADHISGSPRLKDITGAQMLMHASATPVCVDRGLRDGETVTLGEFEFEVWEAPGHANDHVVLLLPGRVLTGDTLLIGGCGRTDLPTSAAKQMYETLQRIIALPPDTIVYPGHDYQGRRASTIGQEIANNPRLAFDSADAFIEFMNARRTPFPRDMSSSIAGNQSCR